ncbi:MAG: DNA-binding protein [Alphaproteobacteria bacterium]|nr:MAG: DNA-binding protein [Alphaproteobacteria bacterium]
MERYQAKFQIGQIIRHRLFEYTGVIYDADPTYQGTGEWYDLVALSRPPKNEPWYRVLVHNAFHTTYVAEKNLDVNDQPVVIKHPLIDDLFSGFDGEYYHLRQKAD